MALPSREMGGVRIAQEFGVSPGATSPSPGPASAGAGAYQQSMQNYLSNMKATQAAPQPTITRQAPSPFTPAPQISPTGLGGIGGGGNIGGGTGGFTSTYERGPGTPGNPNDPAGRVNPELEAALLSRMQGEGIGPSFEQIVNEVYNPQAALIDQAFERTRDDTFADLAGRGVLDSSTTNKNITRLAETQGLQKAALLGQLGLDHEDRRQRAIGEAIGQLGILEGNKLQSRTSITTANIAASAQVRAASIGANASVASAKIGAQAQLQAAGMNAKLALAQLQQQKEMTAFEAGVDLSDPQSVQDWYDYQRDVRQQEIELIEYDLNNRQTDSRGHDG